MINAAQAPVKLPSISSASMSGTFLPAAQVPVAWAPIPDGIVTGGYRYKKFEQFKPRLAGDPAPINNMYLITGVFKAGAEKSDEASLQLRPQLTGDFDLVDYLEAIDHESVEYDEDEAQSWLVAHNHDGEPSKHAATLKHLAKRKMYAYAQENPTEFGELFAQFKSAFVEAVTTYFFPPTYLMMSGWGLHCLWHLTPDDIRAQVNEPAKLERVKTLNAWLVNVINAAHAKSQADHLGKPEVTVLPVMDDENSAPGTGSLCFPGVKNMKSPTNHRQTFIYPIGDVSSGVALSLATIEAKLAESGVAESAKKPATGGKGKKQSAAKALASGTPDASGFNHNWENFAEKQVRLEPNGEWFNLAKLCDSIGLYGKLKIIDPISGTSTGSGWIQKDVGKDARVVNDAAKTIWHDNRGGYVPYLQRVMGAVMPNSVNLSIILSADARLGFTKLAYDTFTNKLDKDRTPVLDTDNFISGLNIKLNDTFGSGFPGLREGVYHEAKSHSYDSLYQFITRLPAWDGVKRIHTLFEKGFPTAEHNTFVQIASYKCMTGWAARALSYDKPVEMHIAPVLCGAQFAGKSEFIKALFYQETHKFHAEGTLNMDTSNKESILAVQGKWIYEIAELAGLAKTDNEAVKNWLSCSSYTLRVPYARDSVTWNARCCFFGTTNDEEFLRDDTGNRRLLPVNTARQGRLISQFDMDWTLENRDQLWAEARDIAQAWIDAGRNKRAMPWNLTLEEVKHLNSLSPKYSVTDIESAHGSAWLDEKVADWIHGGSKEEERPTVTMLEFLQHGLRMEEKNVLNKKNSYRAKILKANGWIKLDKQLIVRDERGRSTGSRTLVYEYRP